MKTLRVENIKKVYGYGAGQVEALRGVSFGIEKGEFVAVMGPSGSGKSTMLHIIGALAKPTGGKIFIDDMDIYKKSEEELAVFRRRNVGLIHQFYNLIPILNVEENIMLPIQLDNRQIDRGRFEQLISDVGLIGKEASLPEELSGGQQQRVAIARALVNSPALLLADEPTGNLDNKNTQEIIALLKKSNRKYGQTTIMVTHDEDVALQADRLITLDDGLLTRDQRIG